MAAMPMLKIRNLRRRWVLLLIFGCSLIYALTNIFNKDKGLVSDEYEIKRSLLRQPFEWQPQIPDAPEVNASKPWRCRNSVQGKALLVDERGYVCERGHLDLGGCCDTKHHRTTKHTCDTCSKGGCCALFEHCVSCCLHPDKQPLMKRILQERREALDKLFASVENLFDLCLSKCRTSSMSVQHENSYRNSKTKHCYGESPPELQSMMIT